MIAIYSEVSTQCQNRCIFCPCGMDDNIGRRGFIDDATREAVINLIKTHPHQRFLVFPHLIGEPLLYPKLESYIHDLQALPNTETWVCTNGLMLNERRTDTLLKAGLRQIWFTMFGTNEQEYDSFTVTTGHFKCARSNFLNLLRRHQEFDRIHVTTFSQAWSDFNSYIEMPNVTTELSRPILEWRASSMKGSHRHICITINGAIVFTWQDYKLADSIGNIKTMMPEQVMANFLALAKRYQIDLNI